MSLFKGFVYSKLHSMGTRSEGPAYFLEVYPPEPRDYRIVYKDCFLWQDDPELHKFLAKKVKIDGDLNTENPDILKIKTIEQLPSQLADWGDN